jgi:hypothetical protein
MPVRHLRKLYVDPMSGEADLGHGRGPGRRGDGRVQPLGRQALKTGNFLLKNQEFEQAERYENWKFVHSPPGLGKAIEKSVPK